MSRKYIVYSRIFKNASAILPEAISDGGLTPTTDADLLLATYRGGSHLTSDIFSLNVFGYGINNITTLC